MPLLERESALASLAEYAQQARAGEGRLVLVGGEAGVGKSSLVDALAERLHGEMPGARWSWGICDGLFTPRPLGPLFDVAAELGGELLALCRGRASREELFGALLRQLSEPGTLDVMVLEDLHWADEATIDLLRFLGRRLRSCSVLLIATYRDDGLTPGDPLRIALGELGTQRSTRRIGLGRLSAEAVRILAGDSGLEPVQLYRLTGGNPFFVTEVVRAGSAEVPASARDAVLARVAQLGAAGREVLDIGALVGTRIDPRLLAAVTLCPPETIDELVTSGLLVGDAGWLRFRHELGRLAVEQAIPAHRLAGIHAGILAALVALGSDDDAGMAFHAEAAQNGPAVLHYAERAARRAAELASHREAAAQYTRALRYAGDLGPVAQAELYDSLTYELSLVDKWQDAAEAAEQARARWCVAGDRLREGDSLRRLSGALVNLCRGEEAIQAAQDALATLEPLGPSAELAWSYAALALQWMLTDRAPDAIDLAIRAQRIAEPLGLFQVQSDALNTEACATATIGGDWIGRLLQALDIALEHGLDEQAARAYTNLYGLNTGHRQFAEAEKYYVDGLAYCDDHDVTTFGSCLRGERASSLAKTGAWDEAVALSRQLLVHLEASPINRISPLLTLGLVHARRGEPGVWDGLDEAAATADGSREPQWIICARLARAEASWLAGDLGAARREAELADDVAAGSDAWVRGAVAVWLHRTGSERPVRGQLADPYRLELDGEWSRAAQCWIDRECSYDAALVLLESGEEAALRQALGILVGLGATAVVHRVRLRMREQGVRSVPVGPRTATRAHPLGLTRREHEVLDLLCAGHTNAEIADVLVIATKTVDHHVSAVLAKLGAPTRAAAAAAALRLGLVTISQVGKPPPAKLGR